MPKLSYAASETIRRAADTHAPFVGHMGINHRGIEIDVTEQLLNRSKISASVSEEDKTSEGRRMLI